MNPNHYRFPRTYRDAFGGEQMYPLRKRFTFLRTHRDALVFVVAVLITLAIAAGWIK